MDDDLSLLSPQAAIALQRQLAPQVETLDRLPARITRVAGIDVGFEDEGRVTRAAVVVLSFPDLAPQESRIARRPTHFPYVPGLLSFRELPAVEYALDALTLPPDVILCDGQGIAHPRRLGIASHLGLRRDIPTIGVGKSRLCGHHGPVPDERGAWTPLIHRGETIGAVLRTRPKVSPVYISSGHRISLAHAIDLVMACTTRYRLPETTRAAHRLASDKRYRTATASPSSDTVP